MADVFISHHEESAGELAAQIAKELESMGISCWYAPRNMGPGPFRRQIYRAIRDCKVFLLLVNPNITSSEILGECEIAYTFYKENAERVSIVPFLVDGCPLPLEDLYHFTSFQHIDGSIPTLVNRLTRILDVKPPTPPPVQQPPTPPPVQQPPTPPPVQQPPTPPQPKILKRGGCGYGVTYTLDERGVLTISGSGPMRDFVQYPMRNFVWYYDNRPWREERETISHVEIERGVTAIGDYAFDGCEGLTGVTIPHSVTEIGERAFDGCAGLTGVTIPHSVTEIGEGAFEGCAGLTGVTIPNSVTSIGACAFYGCGGLTGVTIPDSVTSIGAWAFYGCAGLTGVTIPDSVTKIGFYAFHGCKNLKRVSVPAKAKRAGAFSSWTEVERRP